MLGKTNADATGITSTIVNTVEVGEDDATGIIVAIVNTLQAGEPSSLRVLALKN